MATILGCASNEIPYTDASRAFTLISAPQAAYYDVALLPDGNIALASDRGRVPLVTIVDDRLVFPGVVAGSNGTWVVDKDGDSLTLVGQGLAVLAARKGSPLIVGLAHEDPATDIDAPRRVVSYDVRDLRDSVDEH